MSYNHVSFESCIKDKLTQSRIIDVSGRVYDSGKVMKK